METYLGCWTSVAATISPPSNIGHRKTYPVLGLMEIAVNDIAESSSRFCTYQGRGVALSANSSRVSSSSSSKYCLRTANSICGPPGGYACRSRRGNMVFDESHNGHGQCRRL